MVRDPAGNTALYAPIDASPVDSVPPVPTGTLTLDQITKNGARLRFSAAMDETAEPESLRYSVLISSTSSAFASLQSAIQIGPGGFLADHVPYPSAFYLEGLPEAQTHWVGVLVADEEGNRALYPSVSFTTLDAPPPVPGTGTSVGSISTTSAQLSWGAAADLVSEASSMSYKVVAADVSATIDTVAKAELVTGADIVLDWAVNVTSMALTGLTPGSSRHYTVLVRDAAGNKALYAPVAVSTLSLQASLNQSLRLRHVWGSADYELTWSALGIPADHSISISQVDGATPTASLAEGFLVYSGLNPATDGALLTATGKVLPQSVTLFVCDPGSTCANASVTLDGGLDSLQNDSDGSNLRFRFSTETGTYGQRRIVSHTSSAVVNNWDGFSSTGYERSNTSGLLNCSNPATGGCAISVADSPPWQKHYVRIAITSTDGRGVTLSPVSTLAHVPDGMVYIDKSAWPNEPGLVYDEWQKFSFAIDKFEVLKTTGELSCTVFPCPGPDNTGVLESKPYGSPSALLWADVKQGCANRTVVAGYDVFAEQSAHPTRAYHMPVGPAWITAAYGTPALGGAGNCNTDNRGTRLAPEATGSMSTANCISHFGARNMIGNGWEATDEAASGQNRFRFYGTGAAHEERLPAPHPAGGTTLSWDTQTVLPIDASRNGPWTGTSNYTWGYNLANGTLYAVTWRGGSDDQGASAGRFTLGQNLAANAGISEFTGRCSILSPEPGRVLLQNDSNGSNVRLRWRIWGNSAGTTVRIALARPATMAHPRAHIDGWNGDATGDDLNDDLFTIDSYTQCTDTSYNSLTFGDPPLSAITSGTFALQGRCGISILTLQPWEKRYVKLIASNAFGQHESTTYVVARVPDGMVFVAADDWPNPQKHGLASEYSESYPSPFDFAIDKYELSASGTVQDCTTNDFPCTTSLTGSLVSSGGVPHVNARWYTFKQGCDNRTSLVEDWADVTAAPGAANGRRVHLATGQEWMVAAFQTPDSVGVGMCNSHANHWDPGAGGVASQNLTGSGSTEFCLSRYGARNMIGNALEWTDDLLHNGKAVNFYNNQENPAPVDLGVPGTWNLSTATVVRAWSFLTQFPTAVGTPGLFDGDLFYDNTSNDLSAAGARYKAVMRGGSRSSNQSGGRFYFDVWNGPNSSSINVLSGRCALRAP